MEKFQAVVAVPGFCLGISANADQVTGIEFLPPQPELAPTGLLAGEAVRQLRLWLDDPTYVFSLPLQPAGTPFQRRVWQQIAAIPCGATRSYGELAKTLATAPRAVGQACGANPYPVVVPCHRVVAASKGLNDGLGGFSRQGGGFLLDIKRWLLAREGKV